MDFNWIDWDDPASIIKKTFSLAKAIVTGTSVSDDVIKKRLEICSDCSHMQIVNDVMQCGICGCKLLENSGLQNLARYEETSDYGCKHPDGSQWKKNGV